MRFKLNAYGWLNYGVISNSYNTSNNNKAHTKSGLLAVTAVVQTAFLSTSWVGFFLTNDTPTLPHHVSLPHATPGNCQALYDNCLRLRLPLITVCSAPGDSSAHVDWIFGTKGFAQCDSFVNTILHQRARRCVQETNYIVVMTV